MLSLPAPAPLMLPAVSQTLVDILRKKQTTGSPVAPIYHVLVRQELQRCFLFRERLTYRERCAAADLLDWYISVAAESIDLQWLQLYRPEHRERRMVASMLDYYSRNLDLLTRRERHALIDICDDFFDTYHIFFSNWSVLYQLD